MFPYCFDLATRWYHAWLIKLIVKLYSTISTDYDIPEKLTTMTTYWHYVKLKDFCYYLEIGTYTYYYLLGNYFKKK